MQNFEISLIGLLAFIGLIQTLYAVVYLSIRAGDFKRAFAPILFFTTLSGAFLFSFIIPYAPDLKFIAPLKEGFWLSVPIISCILIIQVAKIESAPSLFYQSFLLGVAIIFALSFWAADFSKIVAIIMGALALLSLWVRKDLILALHNHKVSGFERYWLILTLIFINTLIVGFIYARLSEFISVDEYNHILIILGLALVYLVSTTMFRIYPQALQLVDREILKLLRAETRPPQDSELVLKLKDLLDIQKLYQEPNFSRSELAKEMGVSETVASKLVNEIYGKTLPQLISERRVSEACDLLKQTDESISKISEQVGFNSIASFNRVFKEITGFSPSEFRRKK